MEVPSEGDPASRRRASAQPSRSAEPEGRGLEARARAPPQERGVDEGAGMSGRAGERAEGAGPLRGGEGLGQCSASGRAASRGLGWMTMSLASRGRHSLVRGGGALRLRLARAGIAMVGSAFRLKTQVSGCLGSARRLFPILCGGGGGGGTEPSSRRAVMAEGAEDLMLEQPWKDLSLLSKENFKTLIWIGSWRCLLRSLYLLNNTKRKKTLISSTIA